MARETTTDEVKKVVALGFTPGEIVTWEAIEEVLAPLTRRERRFQTIYRAVMTYMEKWQNRVVEVKPGVGLQTLHDHERAGAVVKSTGRAEPILKRARDAADRIPITKLEGLRLEEAQHVRVGIHRLYEATAEEMARLAMRPGMPPPTPPSPRRATIGPGESTLMPQAS